MEEENNGFKVVKQEDKEEILYWRWLKVRKIVGVSVSAFIAGGLFMVGLIALGLIYYNIATISFFSTLGVIGIVLVIVGLAILMRITGIL